MTPLPNRAIIAPMPDDTGDHQVEYAQRIAKVLNLGVLQDAVAVGLEDQGQFRVDVLDLMDALESAGLKLVPDDAGEVAAANSALVEARRRDAGA